MRSLIVSVMVLGATVLHAADATYRIIREIPIGGDGGWDYVIVDPSAHRVYVSHATKIVVADTETGRVVAGVRTEDGKSLADVRKLLRAGTLGRRPAPRAGENTTIGLVATNARLTKTEINRVAAMADDGFARAINPSHTTVDGDTVFSLATGRWQGEANVSLIGALAAEAMAEAIVRAVSKAESLNGVPAARELGTVPARIK